MALLGIDLGGTKLALGLFNNDGKLLHKETVAVSNKKGKEVGELIINSFLQIKNSHTEEINSVGISVPGIYHLKTGTVWAPNIQGWDDYPLYDEIKKASEKIPVTIDSDRACYILGEAWQGNAKECKDAIFLAVGTGIGAGILINGNVLRGSNDIAGAIGWMALDKTFKDEYISCGCFEHYASGEGIAKTAIIFLKEMKNYAGELKNKTIDDITSYDVFAAYENDDALAKKVIQSCIEFWGMAAANIVSLFNPEKIIFGGGVFGPAIKFLPAIMKEAMKWAQPISMQYVTIEPSALDTHAGLYGAAWIAKQKL